MFSIGEFSKLTGLSVRTLRFYHDKGLLVPASVDAGSGYRFYDERNLEAARVIVALRDLEFSLDDVGEILSKHNDDADILDWMDHQKRTLSERLSHYQDVLQRIESVIQFERQAREKDLADAAKYEITEKQLPTQLVAGSRMKGKYSDSGKVFGRLGKTLGRHIAGKPLCLYYDGEYREDEADFEPCMPVRKSGSWDGLNVRELPGGRCVSLVHQGPYTELSRSYARLLRLVKQRDYEFQLPTREVYLKGPGMIFSGNPKKYLTEIQLLVAD